MEYGIMHLWQNWLVLFTKPAYAFSREAGIILNKWILLHDIIKMEDI